MSKTILFLALFLVLPLVGLNAAEDLVELEEGGPAPEPSSALEFFNRAVDRYTLGEAEKALRDLDQCLEKDPYFERAYNYRGILHSRQGKLEKARENYEKALRIEPMYADACQNLGRLFLEKGDHAAAIVQLKKAAFLNVDDPTNHYLLGVANYLRGDLREAIREYRQTLQRDPDFMEGQVYYNLGICHQELSEYRDALENFEEYLPRKAVPLSLLNNLALCHHAVGQGDRAIGLLDQVLRQDPNNFKALLNLGNILLDRRAYEMAEKVYARALALPGGDRDKVENNLGLLRLRTRRPAEALALWERILERDSANVQALNHLANTHLELRNFPEAIRHLKSLIRLDPGNGAILNALGYTLVDQNLELEYARQCIEKALAQDPANHAIYQDSLGWYHYRMGDFQKAREVISRALAIFEIANEPGSSEIFYHLALVQRALSDKEGELASLRQAIRVEPKSHFALQAGKELALLEVRHPVVGQHSLAAQNSNKNLE